MKTTPSEISGLSEIPYRNPSGKWLALANRRTSTYLRIGSVALMLLACEVGALAQSTIFSENMGTPSGTTTIAANTFQNSATLTYSSGAQANPADVRITSASSGYTGASGSGNVYFTSSAAAYGFSIESINAAAYASLTLSYAYRKESASSLATFSVDYWNGTSWVTVANTSSALFNEASGASSAWYAAKTLSLPTGAQIAGLKIRFVKTGAVAIRIDDVKLTGTLSTPSITGAATASAFTTTYGTASSAQSFSVSGANLTANITATAPTGFEVSSDGTTYGSTATFTQSGGSASGTLRVRLAATAVPGGTYNSQNIVLSSTGASSVNITTALSGNSVGTKTLIITGLTGSNKTYDGLTGASVTGTAALSGVNGTDTVTLGGTPSYSFANKDVGDGKTVITSGYTISGAQSSYYTLTQPTLTANITARALSITANNVTKAYGSTLTGGAGSTAFASSGLQNGETIGTVSIAYGTGAAAGDAAGTYTGQVTPSAAIGGTFNSANYAITYVAGDITVSASPTISVSGTLSALSTTYGTASSAASFLVSGGNLSGDLTVNAPTGFEASTTVESGYSTAITLTASGGTVSSTTIYVRLAATSVPATYSGNVTVSGGGATSQTVATVASTVGVKTLTVTGLTAHDKTYDRSATASVTGTASLSGVNGSDDVSLSGTASYSFPDKAAGNSRTVTTTGLSLSGAQSSYYSLTSPSFTANINAAPLTIPDAAVTTKTYDGTTAATITGTLTGVISGDTATFSGTGTFSSANANTGISVTSTTTLGGTDAGNYSLTQPTGLTGTINKMDQTITFGALPSGKKVGDAAFSAGASISSGQTIGYASSNPNVASIDASGMITLVAAGVTTITTSQAGDDNHNAATPVSHTLDVAAAGGGSSTIALWTFETSQPSASSATISGISAESGSGTASGHHASASTVWSSPSGNGSVRSLSANYWAVGDYLQFQISTVGKTGISFGFDAYRSSSGPTTCKIQYSTDGTTYTDFGSSVTIFSASSWSSSTPQPSSTNSFDLSSVSAINSQSSVYFRIVITAGTAGTGTFRVDNVTVSGTQPATPAITPSGSFSAVTTTYGTASAASVSTVAVSGGSLTGDITATAPTGFQVSSDGSTWGTTATFTQSGGFADGTLYVRLAANAPVSGSYNNVNIVLSSTGASSVNVHTAASGNAVNPLVASLTGSRFYDGTTAINASALSVGNKFGSDNVTVATGSGTLSGAAIGTQTISSVGTLTLGGSEAANYTTSGASGTVTITGTMSGGTTTVTAPSASDMNLTLDSGTLLANNTSGSINGNGKITVNSGATLGGTGRVGDVDIKSGGGIAPGASIGTLTTGAETWYGGGTYTWEIDDATGSAGSSPGWDLINLSGNLTIAATNSNPFAIVITKYGTTGWPTGFDQSQSYTWKIAEVTDSGSSVVAFNAAKFTVSTSNFGTAPNGTFSVVLVDKAVCVVYAPTGSPCLYSTTRANWLEKLTGPSRTNMVMVLSNNSGLVSVQALKAVNCTITGMVYSTSGYLGDVTSVTTDAKTTLPANSAMVVLKAVKGTENIAATVNVIAIDTCGRGLSFDPVFTTLQVASSGKVRQQFEGLLAAERYLRVINGTPGLKWLEVNLNGRVFRIDPLADNQEVAADLASAMREGENNVVTLTGGGETGASAIVTITDTPGGTMISLPELVRLAMRQTANGLELSWADTLAGWRLQSSATPDGAWTAVSAEPVAADGQIAVTVPVTGGSQFYRLAGPASENGSAAASPSRSAAGINLNNTPTQQSSILTYGGILW